MSVKEAEIGPVSSGNMGEPILTGSCPVAVYDGDAAAATSERPAARKTSGPGAPAARTGIVPTNLPDASAVRDVYLGEDGLLCGPRSGTVLVEWGGAIKDPEKGEET